MEQTLVLLKPDAITLELTPVIGAAMRQAGLTLVYEKSMQLDKAFMLRWRDFPYYDEQFWVHVAFETSAPIIAQVWQGPNAVATGLAVKKAMRTQYSASVTHNVMHSPDNFEEAKREIALFFPK